MSCLGRGFLRFLPWSFVGFRRLPKTSKGGEFGHPPSLRYGAARPGRWRLSKVPNHGLNMSPYGALNFNGRWNYRDVTPPELGDKRRTVPVSTGVTGHPSARRQVPSVAPRRGAPFFLRYVKDQRPYHGPGAGSGGRQSPPRRRENSMRGREIVILRENKNLGGANFVFLRNRVWG